VRVRIRGTVIRRLAGLCGQYVCLLLDCLLELNNLPDTRLPPATAEFHDVTNDYFYFRVGTFVNRNIPAPKREKLACPWKSKTVRSAKLSDSSFRVKDLMQAHIVTVAAPQTAEDSGR
jgi:hypothetical protein